MSIGRLMIFIAALMVSGHTAHAMAKKPWVAGVRTYRALSYDLDSTAQALLCEGPRYQFMLATTDAADASAAPWVALMKKQAPKFLLVVDRKSDATKLFDLFGSEVDGWTSRGLDRTSSMSRLRSTLATSGQPLDPLATPTDPAFASRPFEKTLASYDDPYGVLKAPVPTIAQSLETGSPELTAAANHALDSAVDDLDFERVFGRIDWKPKRRYTVASLTIQRSNGTTATEAVTCITVDNAKLTPRLTSLLSARLRDHALVLSLYGATLDGRKTCLDQLEKAMQITSDDFHKSLATSSGDPADFREAGYFRDERLAAIRATCAEALEQAKQELITRAYKTP